MRCAGFFITKKALNILLQKKWWAQCKKVLTKQSSEKVTTVFLFTWKPLFFVWKRKTKVSPPHCRNRWDVFKCQTKVELCSKIKLKRIKRIGKRFLCFFQHNRPQPSIAQMTHAEHSSWVIQPQWPPACVSYFYPQMQNPSLQWIAFSPTFDKLRANWRRFIRSFSVYSFFLALDATESCVRRACSAFFICWFVAPPLLWVQALFSRELPRKFPGLFLLPWPKKERSSSFFGAPNASLQPFPYIPPVQSEKTHFTISSSYRILWRPVSINYKLAGDTPENGRNFAPQKGFPNFDCYKTLECGNCYRASSIIPANSPNTR